MHIDVDRAAPTPRSQPTSDTGGFLKALVQAGFVGIVADDRATLITYATDNSIYQVEPTAVLFPRNGSDLQLILQVANRPAFITLKFFPRGGGTGCNGQSLGDGIVIDTSRFMRKVLNFDATKQLVTVEPGMIRDQLAAFLKPHGLFFPPHVSTSSRATIGGMVSNDSSGKGSLIYGKTSAHIHALELVLADGREMTVSSSQSNALSAEIGTLIGPHRREIRRVFPDLTRSFTGYDLLNAINEEGDVFVPALICGSEGTLALIKSITCRVTRIPALTAVVPVRFSSLDAAFRSVPDLLSAKPSAIEFIDDKILAMARVSEFWESAGAALGGGEDEQPAKAMHFVEFTAETDASLQKQIRHLEQSLKTVEGCIGWNTATEPTQIDAIWGMRKACQGLLLARQGIKRAQPFIEDFVVPPESLADMIAELTSMLEDHGIDVGMFGHADVGVVHLRPLLDMTQQADRALIRTISDEVYCLTRTYGGMIWGEHGKGFRGEYMADMLGPRLLGLIADVKAQFDPDNRLNPGKITAPSGGTQTILGIDQVQMRGALDEAISADLRTAYPKALHCNGNGNCFALDAANPICPSYKATGDRRYSPKGRAGLIREWLRLRSVHDQDGLNMLAPQVKQSMNTCLSCKSCSGGACPVRIDIPEMKSRFLNAYHTQHRRPLVDHFVRNLETLLPVLARIGPLANAVLKSVVAGRVLRKLGIVDVPRLQGRGFKRALRQIGVAEMSARSIAALPPEARKDLVVVVQDGFTRFFDEDAALAQIEVMHRVGARVCVLEYEPSGKPLHVKGFTAAFEKQATRHARNLSVLATAKVTMVGMDPAAALMYRHEYVPLKTDFVDFNVQLFSEWLSTANLPRINCGTAHILIQHCTETSLEPGTAEQWKQIFSHLGVPMRILNAGCCGMAGLFGHETAHQAISRKLFEQTWSEPIEQSPNATILATGYSCRSQVKRFSHANALHPAQALLILLREQDVLKQGEHSRV